MNPHHLSFITVFAVVVLTLLQVDAESDGAPQEHQLIIAIPPQLMSVKITNLLSGDLAVHCKSGDDNLRLQRLQPGGDPYHFSFHSNFWGTTLFSCTFWQKVPMTQVAPYGMRWNEFPVWTDHGFFAQKKRPCEQCVWFAAAEAFYRSQSGVNVATRPWRTDKAPEPPPG